MVTFTSPESQADLEQTRAYVKSVAMKYVRNEQDADDVAQDAMLLAHRYRSSFRGESRYSTWLYRVTRNVALELGRRVARTLRLRRALQAMPEEPVVPDPTDGVHARAVAGVVRALFDDLPARQREVFYLADLEELAPVEIARRLGLEPPTVRVHLLRARRTVRERILREHPEIAEEYRS